MIIHLGSSEPLKLMINGESWQMIIPTAITYSKLKSADGYTLTDSTGASLVAESE
jgi:hypothetical protein